MGVAAIADYGKLDPPAVRPLLAIVTDALAPVSSGTNRPAEVGL